MVAECGGAHRFLLLVSGPIGLGQGQDTIVQVGEAGAVFREGAERSARMKETAGAPRLEGGTGGEGWAEEVDGGTGGNGGPEGIEDVDVSEEYVRADRSASGGCRERRLHLGSSRSCKRRARRRPRRRGCWAGVDNRGRRGEGDGRGITVTRGRLGGVQGVPDAAAVRT